MVGFTLLVAGCSANPKIETEDKAIRHLQNSHLYRVAIVGILSTLKEIIGQRYMLISLRNGRFWNL